MTIGSDDDFRSGCRNVSQCHLKQSFSGLHSPGRSQFTELQCVEANNQTKNKIEITTFTSITVWGSDRVSHNLCIK